MDSVQPPPLPRPPERDDSVVRWIPLVVPLLALLLIAVAALIDGTML